MTIATTTRAADEAIVDRLRMAVTTALLDNHRNVAWLSRQTGISSRVLHSRLSGSTEFNLSELGRIASVLGLGWAELAPTGVAL